MRMRRLFAAMGLLPILFCGCPELLDTTRQNLIVCVSSGGIAYTGASIKVVRDDGVVLADCGPASGEHGYYFVELNGLTDGFTVIASGGAFDGVALGGDLKARVGAFDPEIDIVYVNVITTLVDAYMELYPGIALEDAQAAIQQFLELDETVDPGIDLSVEQDYFSQMEFMNQLWESDGFEEFIAALLEEFVSGNAMHPFLDGMDRPDVNKGLAGDTCGFVLSGLATGALSYVGGQSLGWAMNQMGIGDIFGGSPKIDPQVLANMQHSLDQIQGDIVALRQKVDQHYAELSHQVDVTSYDVRMDLLKNFIENVVNTHSRMSALVNITPTEANKDDLLQEKKDLKAIISVQIENHRNQISEVLLGADGRTPLLTLYSRIVSGQKRFFDSGQSQTTQDFWDYFDLVQTGLVQMMVEYYHDSKIGQSKVQSTIDTYVGQRAHQQSLRPRQLPTGYIIDTLGVSCPVGVDSQGLCFDHLAPRMWKVMPVTNAVSHPIFYCQSLANQIQPGWPLDDNPNPYFWRHGADHACGYWGPPTGAEMLDLVSGWTGSSAAQWLVNQGALDGAFLGSTNKYYLLWATMTPIQPEIGFVPPTMGVFDMKTGQIEDFGCNACGDDRYPQVLNYILVRDLANGEFYYYK